MYSNVRSSRTRRKAKWYSKIIVILIPFVIFSVSINVTTRVADAYDRTISKVQEQAASENPGDAKKLSEVGIYVDSAVLSKEISDFMKHKTKEIVTLKKDNEYYEYYLPTKAEFSLTDYSALKKVRMFDDISLVLSFICALWVLAISFYHVREGYETKKQLRIMFRASVVIQFLLQAILFATVFIPAARYFAENAILGVSFAEGDLIPVIFGGNIAQVIVVAEFAITVVITLILLYIVRICTKPRDVFNERRYFR